MEKYNLPCERKKEWLDALLIDKFGDCKNHPQEKFNEKNLFCVDCGISFCKHCKESHSLHESFQIYQYVYRDVVRYSDLFKYFDCSYIQTYVSNRDKMVHLKSQLKPRHLSKVKKLGGSCEQCGKYLQEKRNRFCSIRCKISIEELELSKNNFEELGVKQNDHKQNSEAESSISMAEEPYENVEKVNLRKRPRKSTPIRSLSSFVYCS